MYQVLVRFVVVFGSYSGSSYKLNAKLCWNTSIAYGMVGSERTMNGISLISRIIVMVMTSSKGHGFLSLIKGELNFINVGFFSI